LSLKLEELVKTVGKLPSNLVEAKLSEKASKESVAQALSAKVGREEIEKIFARTIHKCKELGECQEERLIKLINSVNNTS
jgi:hypothetical protein